MCNRILFSHMRQIYIRRRDFDASQFPARQPRDDEEEAANERIPKGRARCGGCTFDPRPSGQAATDLISNLNAV